MENERNEHPLEDFASAMESAFDVEVSKEIIEETKVEELFDEEKLAEVLPDWKDEELEEYQSPNLKKLLDAGKGVCEGVVSDAELKKVVAEVKAELEKTIEEFSNIKKSTKPDSLTAREQVIRIERAFALHRDALEEINRYFKDGDTGHILNGLDMAQRATNRLYKSFLLLQQAAEVATTRMCIKCGHRNPLGANVCENCGAQLPKMEEKPVSAVELMVGAEEQKYYTSPHLDRLIKEVDMLKKGEISPEKFSATIDFMLNNLSVVKKEYRSLDTSFFTEEEKKMFGDLFTSSEKAIEAYEGALQEMKRYFSDSNIAHLDNGLRLAFEATQVIARVHEFAKEVEKNLSELEKKGGTSKEEKEEEGS